MKGMAKRIAVAIGRAWPDHFNYLINNRIICNSLDGDFLRGIMVDRTSTSGVYSIYAFTQPWFSFQDGIHLSLSPPLDHRSGRFEATPETIAEQVRPYLENDASVRRTVFAAPADPPYFAPALSCTGHADDLLISRAEMAAVRALQGDQAWARLTLIQVKDQMADGYDDEDWLWCKQMVTALLDCLEQRGDVRTVLDPLTEKGRASVRIAALQPKPLAKPKPTAAA